jgi:DNA-binding winged helix-turn-helix (wHTH) protein/TolB-like protein/Tfp pilus assembly protein PilF
VAINNQLRLQYEFGPFRLDTAERLLWRDGEPVPLTPKAFEMLVVLVEHSGHLVEKDKLIKALWPDSFVEEANLTNNVWTLRKTLGEGQNSHRYIETIPKRGYRFTAPVRVLANEGEELVLEKHTLTRVITEEEEQTGSEDEIKQLPAQLLLPPVIENRRAKRWGLSLAFGLLFLLLIGVSAALYRSRMSGERRIAEANVAGRPALRSIAVLPFKTIGAGDDNEYLGLGMSDALITKLGNIRQIIVRPTSAVRRYTDPLQDPLAAGREQGVDAVLDGSVQRAGDRIRVTVQLIRVQDKLILWSGQFDERFTDIFAVQDAISQQVTQGLVVKLNDEERKRLQKPGSENIEAYQAYLKGRYFWNKRTPEGFRKAIEYFNRAIELDLTYAEAYAGLADSYLLLGGYGVEAQRETLPKARAAAFKAIELDETLSEPHVTLALILQNYDDWAAVEKEYKRAIELNPNYGTAHAWYGEFLAFWGRFDEGIAEIKRGQALDPLSLIINTDVGKVYYLARQYDLAIEQLKKTLEMDPNFNMAHGLLGLSYAHTGKYEEAIAELRKIENLEDDPQLLSWLGYIYGVAGKSEEARKVLTRLNALSKQTYVSPFFMLLIYTGLGEKDEAFKWLERTLGDQVAGPIAFKVHPDFDSLRSDPRFPDLLRRAGLPQ